MQSDIVYQMYLQMSDNERNDFLQKVYNELEPVTSSNTFESIILAKSNHPLQDRSSCPHCQSLNCVKNGHKDGLQRFRCNDCHKTFTWSNNTIYFGSKKSFATWSLFCECLMNKFSLRRCSEVCKINLHTAFNWRHKVLDALQNMHNAVVLNGIIESDETFFGLSFKGSRHLNRRPHKRGLAATKRGLSAEKVCVPCSVNLNGYSIAKITNLGKPCLLDLLTLFSNRFVKGSILVTDSLPGYSSVAFENNLTHIRIPSGKHSLGEFNIQTINSYHNELKRLVNGNFKGVATKYLNNYIVYHNFVNHAKESFTDKLAILKNFVFSTVCNTRGYKIVMRNAVPV